MTPPDALYARALARGSLHARVDGRRLALPLGRWTGEATAADAAALAWAEGPVLDVGCGPGRHVAALAAAGVAALGLDASPTAVAAARTRGAAAMHGSIFGPVPAAGRWRTALLLDGNIGIGGAPERLLRRVGGLLRGGGAIIAELGPPGGGVRRVRVRLECEEACSAPFPWALVGADAIDPLVARIGLSVCARRHVGDRWFALLR